MESSKLSIYRQHWILSYPDRHVVKGDLWTIMMRTFPTIGAAHTFVDERIAALLKQQEQ